MMSRWQRMNDSSMWSLAELRCCSLSRFLYFLTLTAFDKVRLMAVLHWAAMCSDSNRSSKKRYWVKIVRVSFLFSSVRHMQKPPSIGITFTMNSKFGSLAIRS